MVDRGGTGDRQHHGRAAEEPGEGELGGLGAGFGGDLGQRAAVLEEFAGRQREPRDEADPVLGAVVEQRLGVTRGQVEEVLDVAVFRASSS
jgi:hypothetical protein